MAIEFVKAKVGGDDYIELRLDSQGRYVADFTAPPFSTKSADVPSGFYAISVFAKDTAGNEVTVSTDDASLGESCKLYVRENVAPTINITAPSANAYNTSGSQTIVFDIVDNKTMSMGYSGVDTSTVVVKVDGVAKTGVTFQAITGGYRGTLSNVSLTNGTHTITVDGKDKDNNAATQASVAFIVDTAMPTLENVLINGKADATITTNNKSLTITGRTDDNISAKNKIKVDFYVNNVKQGSSVTPNTDGSFTNTIQLGNDGVYTIKIVATDEAGLKSTETIRTVELITSGPKIKSVTYAPNPANAGATYQIIVEVE